MFGSQTLIFVPKPVNDVDCPHGSYINIIKSQCEPCPAESGRIKLSFPFLFLFLTAQHVHLANSRTNSGLTRTSASSVMQADTMMKQGKQTAQHVQQASSRTNSGLTSASIVVQPDTIMKLAWFQVQDARAVMLAGITTKLEWTVVNHATQAGTLLRLAYFSLTSVESAQQVNTMKIGHRKTVLSVQRILQ